MRPCPACARHVRETTCPFCGAAVPPRAGEPRSVFAGVATRAAVFSALAGCWTGNAPEPQQPDDSTVEHPVDHKAQTAHHDHHKPPASPGTGTIEGTVTDTNTNGPAAFAQVQLFDNSGRVVASTQAQSDGRYRFVSLPPGSYRVHVMARPNHPRMGPAIVEVLVSLSADRTVQADVAIAVPVYHYNPTQTPMPYGAPPARRRVV